MIRLIAHDTGAGNLDFNIEHVFLDMTAFRIFYPRRIVRRSSKVDEILTYFVERRPFQSITSQ